MPIQDFIIEEKRIQLIENCTGGCTDFATYDFVYPNDTSLNCYSWAGSEIDLPCEEHCFFDSKLQKLW